MYRNLFLIFALLFLTTCRPVKPKIAEIPIVSPTEYSLILTGLQASLQIESVVVSLNTDMTTPPGVSAITLDSFMGSGFCYYNDNKELRIVTAGHVVKNSIAVRANIYNFNETNNTKDYKTSIALDILKYFPQEDLSILIPLNPEDDTEFTNCLEIADSGWSPSVSPYLWSFGFMTGWQRTEVVKPVFVVMDNIETPMFRVFPMGQHGDSGGPVINEKGAVVGILIGIIKSQTQSLILPITMLDLQNI